MSRRAEPGALSDDERAALAVLRGAGYIRPNPILTGTGRRSVYGFDAAMKFFRALVQPDTLAGLEKRGLVRWDDAGRCYRAASEGCTYGGASAAT